MGEGFEELKKSSAARFKKIRWAMNAEYRKATHSRIDAFVQRSLKSAGRFQQAAKLKNCGRSSYCGSIYCGGCRDRMAQKLLSRVRAHLLSEDMGDDSCRDRLRWVTVLHSLETAEIDKIKAATKRARSEYTQLNRKFSGSWAQGAFEYELVDMQKVQSRVTGTASGNRKKATLLELGGYQTQLYNQEGSWIWTDKAGQSRTDYVLVHTHFLMDCGTDDWKAIDKDMRRRWYGSYQVRIDTLKDYKVRSLEDSLWKMASYCFKNRCSHHYDFGSYDIDEVDVNENMFNVNELNAIYEIYKSMSGGSNKGLLLGWKKKEL